MKIYSEINLEDFEAWSGAIDTLKRISNAGMCEILESAIDDLYPDGLTDTALNDILWFEPEWCYEVCGMRTEAQIEEELEEAKERLEELKEEFEAESEDLREEFDNVEDEQNAVDDLWRGVYANEVEELEEKIKELEEELENF